MRTRITIVLLLSLLLIITITTINAQLRTDFYRNTCPKVESLVRDAVEKKLRQTFVTAPATLRLFFHDCFVRGCDASILLASPNNQSEKDHPDNLSLAGDGFDTVIKAKAAVDGNPQCKNKVSCADILALATRDVVNCDVVTRSWDSHDEPEPVPLSMFSSFSLSLMLQAGRDSTMWKVKRI